MQSHIFETASYWYNAYPNWKEDDTQAHFFKLLTDYRDQILIQVTAHDHNTDFRYHSLKYQFDAERKCAEETD